MADNKDRIEVNLRVLTRRAPSKHEGRKTSFGLQEKKDRSSLLAGQKAGDLLAFNISASAKEVDGVARFYGPYINGPASNQNLYITWHWQDEATIINRLKVALAIPWPLVQRSVQQGKVLSTDGSSPEWGVLKDWHGLGVGSDWTLAK